MHMRRGRFSWTLSAFVASLFLPTTSHADVKFASADGWELSTNGRVNGFISYVTGDGYPAKNPGQTHNLVAGAGFESFQTDENNKIDAVRLRSGFLSSVLGFTLKKNLSETTSARAHIEIWTLIENARIKAATNYPDAREAYMKLEGPWGGLLVGRSLALFSRGAITLDFLLQHGNGLGYPCNADGLGPTCGHVGYGVIFAGFNPQITYNTPTIAGFQATVGVFDPVSAPGKYERTPLPRVEGELTFDTSLGDIGKMHLFVNGLWQKLVEQGNPDTPPRMPFSPNTTASRGVGYGVWGEALRLKFGFAGHYGYGLGMFNTLENTPAVFDSAAQPRRFDGYYGTVGFDLSPVYVNAGLGVTRVFATYQDALDVVLNNTSLIQTQRGISGGIQYEIGKGIVAALEYFQADHQWYLGESQAVRFVNAGTTMVW
jgi:hypothetical protein